jgi:AcrR family transcriptional regulator
MNVRDQLLDAAVRVFAAVGYRGATTRRIAFEAGVNEITLFRHFGSKDALIREALARVGERTAGSSLPDDPREPFRELMDWARSHITDLRSRRSLIRTCMGEFEEHPGILSKDKSAPSQAAKMLSHYLGRLRQMGIAREVFDESVAATMLMGVLFADAMGHDVMPDMFENDPEDALKEYVRLFLRGIGVDLSSQVGAA